MIQPKLDWHLILIVFIAALLAIGLYTGAYATILRFLAQQEILYFATAALSLFFAFLIACACVILLLERDDPNRVLAWLLVLLAFPVLGFILYLLFGQRVIKRQKLGRRLRRAYGRPGISLGAAGKVRRENDEPPGPVRLEPAEALGLTGDSVQFRLCRLIYNSGGSLLTCSNWIRVLNDGVGIFSVMLAAISTAKHHVHLESYILRDDEIGRAFFSLLADKAAAGVQVRVIADGVGSLPIKRRRIRELRRQGIDLRIFSPLRLRLIRNPLNYRNHRKILVVDGKVGVVGGANIGNDYLGLYPEVGNWRDTQVLIYGPATADLQRLFFQDWVTSTGTLPQEAPGKFYPDFSALEDKERVAGEIGAAYLPALGTVTQVISRVLAKNAVAGAGSPHIPAFNIDRRTFLFSDTYQPAQIAASGPDSPYESIMQAYHYAISTARDSIRITSPYFIPNQSILTALKAAVLAGVNVDLLLPQNPDHQLVYLAAMPYVEELAEDGVKVWLYRKGFIHSKIVTVDDTIAIVGTANMDQRSFALNFEVNAIMYDKKTVAELNESFRQDLRDAELLDYAVFQRRPLRRRLLESCCRLLSPLL
ncbi:MAG: phospholipase D-like domain-containing protein [Peptococcaceae bacterium]|jgi:cardiolipin synthase|nr:phospholipase D-like domain-containing protein [Peptococcaceae bacterium]